MLLAKLAQRNRMVRAQLHKVGNSAESRRQRMKQQPAPRPSKPYVPNPTALFDPKPRRKALVTINEETLQTLH